MAAHAHHTPSSPAVQRQIAANRKRILALEAAIAALVAAAYQHAQHQIAPAQAALLAAYERELARQEAQQRQLAEDDGEDPDDLPPVRLPPTWLSTSQEAHHYLRTVALAVATFALASRLHITNGQAEALELGATETRGLLRQLLLPLAATVGIAAIDRALASAGRSVLDALVGMSASTGKSLADLLTGIGDATAGRLERALLSAVSGGMRGGALGGYLDNLTGMSYRRVLTVSRTELIGAFRGAGLATMQANAQTVAGWIWRAGPNACPFCQSQDGTFHTLDEDMASHPNCQCQQEPVLRPLSEVLSAVSS